MTNPTTRFRQSGSLVAGLLIGLAIVVATFAATDAASSAWQALLIFVAPAVLVLGLALQVLVTAAPRRRPCAARRAQGFRGRTDTDGRCAVSPRHGPAIAVRSRRR